MSTILDVARLAGVSTATVSRVINFPDTVREATRVKVLLAMEKCNYKYNALARGFATKRSNTIGLIIPNINNPVFSDSTLGVQEYADRNKIKIILGNTSYNYSQEENLIKVLRESQVDGLIITTTNPKGEVLKSLVDEGFPFVLLFSTIKGGPISAVGVDNFRGGYIATEHLVSLGHRRIGIVAGNFSTTDRSFHRWHGYKRCLKDHGIPYDKELLVQTEYSLSGGRDSIKRLLALPSPPTAVFCSNDYIALGAIKGAREAGLALPEDLSIVGFDDMPTASYMVPALTTVRQPAYQMGQRACELLLQLMEKPTKPVQDMMDIDLVIRESTTSAPHLRGKGD
ncbi:LacI family transcriptional regulator [Desulfovibrio mangrovi]|uniref:LacI family DNA-binding transcriptional regulator n=1 Tax=Desulfovibrio mangrovi TaxID=2976983 RepID=UPI002246D781|nr:LacI family DNA-binding transcriptional regulator [Desulfovibrio mangrovi]UZP66683.1 LacI family transcriptional regulator [Desulfovibrio mangrovi]